MTGPFDPSPELAAPEALLSHQLVEANRILRSARRSPFYAQKLEGIPDQVESLEQWRAIPTTNKREIVKDIAANPPFGSRGPRLSRGDLAHVVTTSGTTGIGQEVYPVNARDEQAIYRMEARGFSWAGVSDESIVLNTLSMTTAAAGQWYYHGLKMLGATVLQVGPLSTDRKIQHISQFAPDVLIGTPAYMFHLSVRATELGLDPTKLGVRSLVVAGESWTVMWMERLSQAWGARVYEQYGSTQRAMAWSCHRGAIPDGDRGVLHALTDYGLYEVVDPVTGNPVGPGEFGELVITPFCAEAAPLVRFATGDRVRLAPPCACGLPGLGFESGMVSRYDQMVKVKGVNLWPEALDEAVFSTGVAEFEARVELDDRGREILQITVEAGDSSVCELVVAAVRARTGLTPAVTNVPLGVVTAGIAGNFTKRTRLRDSRGGQLA